MKHKSIYPFIFGLLLPLVACSDGESGNDTIRLEIGDKGLTNNLIVHLDRENIWYRVIDSTTLEVKHESAQMAASLLNSMGDSVLPDGRHVSFPKDMFLAVTTELDKNNVSYEIVDFNNSKWIVWEENNTQLVKQVIDEVSRTHDIGEIKEEDFQFNP